MTKPTNPAYFAIGLTFALLSLVFFGTGNTVGIAFLPVGITFLILAFQTPKPKPRADRRGDSSDGGSPVIGATGDGSHGGRADGGGRPDPSPSPSHDGGWGGSDGGGSSDGGGGGGGD